MDTLSRVLYVELYNPTRSLVQSQTLRIDSGRATGHFSLPQNLASGGFTIRAYTRWLMNYGEDSFFYKFIPILNPDDNVIEDINNDGNTSASLKVAFDKTLYRTRNKVTLKLQLEDEEASKASVMISVVDANQVAHIPETNSIKKWYSLNDSLPKGILQKFRYRIERGITFEGVIIDESREKKTELSIIQGDFQNVFRVKLDYRGYFAVHDLSFYDTTKFTIQSANGKAFLKERDIPAFSLILPPNTIPPTSADRVQKKYSYDTASTIMLKEVEIKKKKLLQHQNRFERPDFYIKGDELKNYYNLAEAIQSKVPGYRLVLSGMHWRLQWLRSEYSSRLGPPLEPIVYVNNSQLLIASPETDGETVGDQLTNLDPRLIDHIEAASTANTTLGGTGSIGVIYIFTKEMDFPGLGSFPTLKVKGFDRPAVFRSPDYGNPLFSQNPEDFRSTIYWNPRVTLNSKTPSLVSFYTSDQKGTLSVLVEGVTSKGTPLRVQANLVVE